MNEKRPNHPEPVPAASQLAALPFLAAIDGTLKESAGDAKLRITMHRVMAREGEGYLQQLCTYLGSDLYSQKNSVGRMFPVDTGIMGRAFATAKLVRTKYYPNLDQLLPDLKADLIDTNDKRDPSQVPVSYLAIPFLGPEDKVVLTLYAECNVLNFFADKERINQILTMCYGFCRLFDWLNTELPFQTLRNFPLEVGKFRYSTPTAFPRLQEEIECRLPRFQAITSFNYDASVG